MLDNKCSGESSQQTGSSGKSVGDAVQLWHCLMTGLEAHSYYNNTRYYYQNDTVQHCKLTAF